MNYLYSARPFVLVHKKETFSNFSHFNTDFISLTDALNFYDHSISSVFLLEQIMPSPFFWQ